MMYAIAFTIIYNFCIFSVEPLLAVYYLYCYTKLLTYTGLLRVSDLNHNEEKET